MTKLYLNLFPDPTLAAGLSTALSQGVASCRRLAWSQSLGGLIAAIGAAVPTLCERKERNAKDTRRDGVIARENNQ
jgi:hypothetical protein